MTSSSPNKQVLLSLINFLAQTPSREKICRLFQYFTKYLASSYVQLDQLQPFRRNELQGKIKKAQSLSGSMSLARKILRFGPSINCVRTFIVNTIQIIEGKNLESTPVFALKTLSALWIALFFVSDHYLWLFKMGIAKNERIRVHAEYLSILGWYLDCYTGIIKNILIYLNASSKERKAQTKALIIDSIRLLLDIPVAYSFLHPGSISGKTVGALGTVTSAIGLYQMWQ